MKKFLFFLPLFFTAAFSPLNAQTLILTPESTLYLSGEATLQGYSSKTSALEISAQIETAAESSLQKIVAQKKIKDFKLKIPVRLLRSQRWGLDENLRHTLKVKDFPDIVFKAENYELIPSEKKDFFYLRIRGALTIAGQTCDIQLEPVAHFSDGKMILRGSQYLKMTDFNISPPTLLFGLFKASNTVRVDFNLKFILQD